MDVEPNDQEFESLLRLPPHKRYAYFVKRVVDFDRVWMIEDDEGLMSFNHEGGEILPVWPARRYAEHAVKKNLPDVRYVAIDTRRWLERTLAPLKDADDVEISVFADAEGYGQQATASDMIADIEAELATRLESLPGFDPNAEDIDLDELLKPAIRASMRAKPKSKLP